MRIVGAFGRFWWDFIVGDDWRIAAGIVFVLATGALLVSLTDVTDTLITVCVAAGIVAVAIGSILSSALAAVRDESKR